MVGMMTEIEDVPEWWIQAILPLGSALMLLVALAQLVTLLTGGTPEHLPSGQEELPRDLLARGE